MILFIQEREPVVTKMTGKWLLDRSPIVFYLIIKNKREVVQPFEKARQFILSLTVENPTVTGIYVPQLNSIQYTLDMKVHKLKLVQLENRLFVDIEEQSPC